MNFQAVRESFRQRISEQIDLEPQGENRFRVHTPFRFEDGDHYNIVLKNFAGSWVLTDEASTFMHVSYWMDAEDFESGNRKQIVDSALSLFAVENREGELIIPVSEERFGDALFDFVQALSKITDVSFLSREVVRSTFMDDLAAFLRAKVPPERIQVNWHDDRDPTGKYPVDFRLNHMKRPLFIYGLPGEEKVKDATISLLKFETWKLDFQSLAVFEDMQSVGNKALARFADVVGKSYSSLDENRERIGRFLEQVISENP